MKSTANPCLYVIVILFIIFAINSLYRSKDNNTPSGSRAVDFPSARMRAIYSQQASGRRNAMKGILETKEMSPALFYNVIVPEILCAELVRIGTIGDGGKWMCSPEEMPADCTVLSLGLNNIVSFDDHLQILTNKRCRLIGYDAAEQNEATKKRFREINGVAKVGFIAKEDGPDNRISLETIMKENDIQEIEIFKVDIEESEFEVIIPFLTKHKVSQLLIEIHAREPGMKPAAYKFVDLLSQLNKLGYLIANYEINGAWHELSEFTLIHHSALAKYKAYSLAQYMDLAA